MRYPASEKLEIIKLVEQSHLPARRTLEQLGIPRRTFYRWYDNYLGGGPEALADRPSTPGRVWNRVPAIAPRTACGCQPVAATISAMVAAPGARRCTRQSPGDRRSVGEGKGGSVAVDPGGRRIINKTKQS